MDRVAHALPLPGGDDRDQIVLLGGMSWSHYQSLLDARGKARHPRMAYLDGVLELMTTSAEHEYVEKMLGRLVECWAEERGNELNGLGMMTFRKKAKRAALEADECYWIDKITRYPQLAIEVVYTSGGVDKLEIFRRLGVVEVWFWIEGKIWVYGLVDGDYELRSGSSVLDGINLQQLARIVARTDWSKQTSAIRTYRRSLRRKR